jgi:hypothetical protein
MKTKYLLFVLLVATVMLSAQDFNTYLNLSHSSLCPDGYLRLRWLDMTGNSTATQCFYSLNGSDWQFTTASPIQANQMEAVVPYEFGQSLHYRLRTPVTLEGEEVVFMHIPYLSSDVFPPALSQLGEISTDPTGDSDIPDIPALDLTDCWCGATETKLYSAMANVANAFPLVHNITSYNLFATFIFNPETVIDTLCYAMIYTFNIPSVISPGLYKMGIDLEGVGPTSFVRIGDIQSTVSNGKLILACNMSDLINDPDFGNWPNLSNALIFTNISVNFGLLEQQPYFTQADYTSPGFLFFQNYHYQVNQNTLPQLTNLTYNSTTHLFEFDYTDNEEDFPLLMEVELAGGQILEPITLNPDYSQIVHYSLLITNPSQYITVRCSDNLSDIVEVVYDTTAVNDETITVPALQCQMPNPYNPFYGPCNITISGLDKRPVKVELFNVRGQLLGTLYTGNPLDDKIEFSFNGSMHNFKLNSGIYFIRIQQSHRNLVQRFILE